MMIPRLRWALLICAAASGAVLLFALSTEWYGGLVPCALCLVERWPYRITVGLAGLGLIMPRHLAWGMLGLCALVMLGGAVAGGVHVGVESGWWPSPLPECAAPRMPAGLSIAERLARMPDSVSKPCDEPTYLIPGVPVSFAAMNMIFALALAGGLIIFMVRSNRSTR